MKASHDPASFGAQLSGLKTSLVLWEDLIGKSGKLNVSLNATIQCVAGFLEAFQKISDIAQTSSFGLQDLGMAMTRFCLRQRGVESRLRTFNSQLNDCLVTPLSDRVEDWRRTVNQIDRDTAKELRKARSELQRATLEAEKWKKRCRRKDSTSTMQTMFAFTSPNNDDSGDGQSGSNVQINFAQRDLVCKQRDLERLERDCLQRVLVEDRRRFAEFTTCLGPVLDAQVQVLIECGPLEEAVTVIRHHMADTTKSFPCLNVSSSSAALDSIAAVNGVEGEQQRLSGEEMPTGLRLRPSPLTLDQRGVGSGASHPADQLSLSPSIATGSAALSFAATRPILAASSQLSLNSTASSAFGLIVGGGGNGCGAGENGNDTAVGSVSTLHHQINNNNCMNTVIPQPPPPLPMCPTFGVASPGDSVSTAGDAISLFDAHNNSDILSMDSSNSLVNNSDTTPAISCNGKSRGPGSDGFSNGLSPVGRLVGFPSSASASGKGAAAEEEEDGENEEEKTDGGTTEGGTEDDDDDEEEEVHSSRGLQRRHTLGPAMEKSVLYPDQSVPPPVYTNFSKLQKAAAQAINTKMPANSSSDQHNDSSKPSTPTRKFSHPATVLCQTKPTPPGLCLLRNLSVSGTNLRSGSPRGSPTHSLPPPLEPNESMGCPVGEGLMFPPASHYDTAPIIADQTSSPSPYASAPSKGEAMFAQAHASMRGLKSARQPGPFSGGNCSEDTVSLGGGEMLDSSSPPPNSPGVDPMPQFAGINSGTSTFRRPKNTAGISRGSMFQLGRQFQHGADDSVIGMGGGGCGIDRYDYSLQQQPVPDQQQQQIKPSGAMTPGPPRRANQLTRGMSMQDTEAGIRPPRRSSSVSRELPSMVARAGNSRHIFGDYASPRALDVEGQRQSLADSFKGKQGTAAQAPMATANYASQLAAEAAAKRRGQQHQMDASSQQQYQQQQPLYQSHPRLGQQHYAAPSGMRNTGVKVLPSELSNSNGSLNASTRLPQRSQNSPIGMLRPPGTINTPKIQRLAQSQQQLPQPPQVAGQQQQSQRQSTSHYQQLNQGLSGGSTYRPQYGMMGGQFQHYTNTPPPVPFCNQDDIESTSFIDSSRGS